MPRVNSSCIILSHSFIRVLFPHCDEIFFSFYAWFISFNILSFRLMCVVANGRISFYFFTFFLLLFKYSFLPFPLSPPHLPPLFPPPPFYGPRILYNSSCKPFTPFPYNPLPSPLWSLSACSQFQCLWLYFACLFILLIRFLLKVRSYGNKIFFKDFIYLFLERGEGGKEERERETSI